MKKVFPPLLFAAAALVLSGCGFVGTHPVDPQDPPGFFLGLWHGVLAPWSLIARIFLDVKMYATPNSGWFYDFGYWIGITGSIPFGWVAAIIAVVVHIAANV